MFQFMFSEGVNAPRKLKEFTVNYPASRLPCNNMGSSSSELLAPANTINVTNASHLALQTGFREQALLGRRVNPLRARQTC